MAKDGLAFRRFAVSCLLLGFWFVSALSAMPTNVILFIGDGMGYGQVAATGLYANGASGTLSFEAFPHQAQVATYSASSSVTDSAAAATAMATGQKVNNGVISVRARGMATNCRPFSSRPWQRERARGW